MSSYRTAPIILVVAALALAASAGSARASDEPTWAWCDAHHAFVANPHDCDRVSGLVWDDALEAYVRPEQIVTIKKTRDDGSVSSSSEEGKAENKTSPGPVARLRRFLAAYPNALRRAGRVLGGALLVIVVLSVLAALLAAAARRPVRRRSAAYHWRRSHGVPVGTTVLPDSLIVAEDGAFDGGTALGYPAMVRRDGGEWSPAFVKHMIGAGLRSDQRFPVLRFESDVLSRLDGTGVVPPLLVPAQETVIPSGDTWMFYAMGSASGAPWPETGGLGRDTRLALYALCEALVKLHERGIGHHDLKPQNIFWDHRLRTLTLLDFGSAIDHSGLLVNPLGSTYPKSEPWVAPAADGRCLAELSLASDTWVYGLLFCEALVGGIHETRRAHRRSPENPEDRDWLRNRLNRAASPAIAEAVIDGLLAPEASHRMAMSDFLALLQRERWA